MSDAQQRVPDGTIEAWRRSGAWQADPARFFFLESLARRIADQPPAVQGLLQAKLQDALADFAARIAGQPAPAPAAVQQKGKAPVRCLPLVQLNEAVRSAAAAHATKGIAREPPPDPHELASARRFRRTWDRSRTLEQVERAVARAPANAGPLNSHVLVLQSLDRMRGLSTDYLRRFLVHVEALQWLEDAAAHAPARPGAPARRARARK